MLMAFPAFALKSFVVYSDEWTSFFSYKIDEVAVNTHGGLCVCIFLYCHGDFMTRAMYS